MEKPEERRLVSSNGEGKEEREIEEEAEDGGFTSLERKRTSLLQVEKNRAASGYAKMERKTGGEKSSWKMENA